MEFEFSGKIIVIYVCNGDMVCKGDVVMFLNDIDVCVEVNMICLEIVCLYIECVCIMVFIEGIDSVEFVKFDFVK